MDFYCCKGFYKTTYVTVKLDIPLVVNIQNGSPLSLKDYFTMEGALMVTFLLFLIVNFIPYFEASSLTYSAINEVLNRNFASESGKLDIFWCGTRLGESENLVNQLLRRKKLLSIQVKTCDDKVLELDTSTFLLFDSPEIFNREFEKIFWQTSKSERRRHLVHIFNATLDFVPEIEEIDWSIDNVAFLVNETKESIDLATFFLFTDKKCRQNQLVTINRFRKELSSWENDNFWPKKYQNFHACPMTLVYNNSEATEDLFNNIVVQLSTIYRFEVRLINVSSYEDIGLAIQSNDGDFYKLLQAIVKGNEALLHTVVVTENGVFVIPPGTPLTAFEKLLSPFDRTTWILIFSILATSFLAIQIVGLSIRRFRDLCFGDNVQSPTMNLLSVFMCGGQTKAPKTTNARLIFLNFVVWSLLIRTCFQSLSYRALQMDLRHPPIQTLDELIVSGFTQSMPMESKEALDGQKNRYGYLTWKSMNLEKKTDFF